MRIALVIPAAARGRASRLFWGVARGVAPFWLAPALIYNVHWHGQGGWQENATAVALILVGALFFDNTVRARSIAAALLFGCATAFMLYVNTKQATRNLSLEREGATQAKLTEIAGGSQVASQRSQLETARRDQTKIVGESAVGTLEADLLTIQLSDPKRWSATSQCEDVTMLASGAFCGKVATARGKIAAAKARDAIDVKLAALPKASAVEATTTDGGTKTEIVADAYVANTLALLKEAGFNPTERLIKAEEVLSRAFGFELTAMLGPTGWLLFISGLQHGHVASTMSRLRELRRKKPPKQEPAKFEPTGADDVDRCITELFEDSPTGSMRAKEIRPLVQTWFDGKGLKLDETKLWARMGERFKRDPNNNRPRYIGLKPRPRPGLRVAVSN